MLIVEWLPGVRIEQGDGCGKEAFFVRLGDGATVSAVSPISEMTQEFRGVLGVVADAPVHAGDHHPAPGGAPGAQLAALVGQLLLVGGRVEAGEVEAGHVVEVHHVGHGGERLPVDRLQERLVGGQVVECSGLMP